MERKIKIPELDIVVEDISEYEDEACNALDDFCNTLFADPKNTRKPTEGDVVDDEIGEDGYIWCDAANQAIIEERERLYAIGRKYFGEHADLDISSMMYVEC